MLVTLKKLENPLFEWVNKRIYQDNSNVVMLITGDPGTGKSYSSLSFSENYLGQFNPDFAVFDTLSLIRLIKQIAKTPTKYKGSVINYEEPQGEQSNKRSSSNYAVALTGILSTFRDLNCILIITSPREHQLTKDLRDYVDVWITTEKIDRDTNLCYTKVKFAQRNEITKKVYWKFLRVYVQELNELFVVDSVAFPKPNKDTIKYYKERKKEYQINYYTKLEKKLLEAEQEAKEQKGNCDKCGSNFGYWTKEGWKCRKCGFVTVRK